MEEGEEYEDAWMLSGKINCIRIKESKEYMVITGV